jgi:hypothetical protein
MYYQWRGTRSVVPAAWGHALRVANTGALRVAVFLVVQYRLSQERHNRYGVRDPPPNVMFWQNLDDLRLAAWNALFR